MISMSPFYLLVDKSINKTDLDTAKERDDDWNYKGCDSGGAHACSMHKAMGSIPSTTKILLLIINKR
jgi:hypothetical protein